MKCAQSRIFPSLFAHVEVFAVLFAFFSAETPFIPRPVAFAAQPPVDPRGGVVFRGQAPRKSASGNANGFQDTQHSADTSRSSRTSVPQPARQEATEATQPVAPESERGTTPSFWTIGTERREEMLKAVLLEGSLAPPVPAKVVRYAADLLEAYDTDGNGTLEKDEWLSMPGAPQALDVNGDFIITLEELVRHIALYGRERTIHRPDPLPVFHQPVPGATGSLRLFQPLSDKNETREARKRDEERVPGSPPDAPLSDVNEADIANAEPVGEETDTVGPDSEEPSFERLAAANQSPETRKYYRPIKEWRGVPAWFILRDKDGDAQITMLEFAPTLTPQALALFGRLDKNGDGILTPDEVRMQNEPDRAAP
ncbi:MAG TPA: hypothetical protein DEB39_05675 [Planctomycetaceae bacterium]|nr:hypothetical protein [Planctomycetaceae bacterium]